MPIRMHPHIRSLFMSKQITGLLLLAAICGGLAALCVGHYFAMKFQQKELESYSNYALNYSAKVAKDIFGSIQEAKQSSAEPCSIEDLAKLRTSLWEHKFIKDIGRVIDGRVSCTAEWGVLEDKPTLPEPTSSFPDQSKHWLNTDSVLGLPYQTGMDQDGNVIVFTSPFAFDGLRQPPSDMAVKVLRPENNFIYRSFGAFEIDSDMLVPLPSFAMWLPFPNRYLHYRTCIGPALCAVGVNKVVGAYELPLSAVLMITGVGVCFGVMLFCPFYIRRMKRHSMIYHLRKAIVRRELSMVYQPKMDLSSKKVIGVESLVRWHSHEFGMVSPDTFIELAERHSLIRPLTQLVIETSLFEMSPLLTKYRDMSLSINLSIQDLLDASLLPFICECAKQNNIRTDQLVFEITERSAGDSHELANIVERYTEQGICISLDDFGTGYSNLAWLGRLNAKEIKVDKSFTQSIGTGSINQTMLDAIFSLVQRLNVRTVFEGVETQEQADYIQLACPNALAQGWLYAKPMIIPQLEAYLSIPKA